MASTDAIAATTDAIRALLDGAAKDSPTFSFATVSIFQSDDLQTLLSARTTPTVSVLLHRISVSPARRNVPLRVGPLGERYRPAIPLDLYYLVSAWAGDARMQQRLLGWAVRVLEDTPILPSALLNDNGWDGTFSPDETVELTWAPLTPEQEFDIWQVAQNNQQPSASYAARTVAIESRRTLHEYALVQTTEWDYNPEGPA
jgi:Pvc16 N-terminal domain